MKPEISLPSSQFAATQLVLWQMNPVRLFKIGSNILLSSVAACPKCSYLFIFPKFHLF
jgi:hypothetical protein